MEHGQRGRHGRLMHSSGALAGCALLFSIRAGACGGCAVALRQAGDAARASEAASKAASFNSLNFTSHTCARRRDSLWPRR
jgi:hypothetical protein